MNSVTITQKLEKLTEGKNKADLARKVGLKPTTVSDYISKAYLPRVDIALKMARALGVPLEWLADDEADFPAPIPEPQQLSIGVLSDRELTMEVARRHRIRLLQIMELFDEAEKVNWHDLWQQLASLSPGQHEAPQPHRDAGALAFRLAVMMDQLSQYDPWAVAKAHHDAMPGSTQPIKDFDRATVTAKWIRLLDLPGFDAFLCQPMSLAVYGFKPTAEEVQRSLDLGYQSTCDAGLGVSVTTPVTAKNRPRQGQK